MIAWAWRHRGDVTGLVVLAMLGALLVGGCSGPGQMIAIGTVTQTITADRAEKAIPGAPGPSAEPPAEPGRSPYPCPPSPPGKPCGS